MENPERMAAFITQHVLMIMNPASRLFSLTVDLRGPLILHLHPASCILLAASLPPTWHQVCARGIWPRKPHVVHRLHPCK